MVRKFYIWLERLTSKITTAHTFVSFENAEKAEKLGLVSRGEWILSRSGIVIDEYTSSAPRRTKLTEWGISKDKLVVGMVACFKPEKAPTDFVDIAARVLQRTSGVHFIMAGDGELRPMVEARIRQHGIDRHITLLGWQSVEVMPEIYRNLDIVVLTSLWEGLPRIFPEAMASGLPVIATEAGGAREAVVHGENGYLFKPHDVDGMATAVQTLLADADLRRKMGLKARERVREFDVATAIAGLDLAYQKCLENGR